MNKLGVLLMVISLITGFNVTAVKQKSADTNLIPRSLLFADRKYKNIQLSPDGNYISYLETTLDGFINIWLESTSSLNGKKKERQKITQGNDRRIADYFWSYDNQHILYLDDAEGDENWRLYGINISEKIKKDLVVIPQVLTKIIARSRHKPHEILIGINERRKDLFDLYLLNIITGEKVLVYENNNFVSFVCDDKLNVKIGMEQLSAGGGVVYALDPNFNKKKLFAFPYEDISTTSLLRLNKTADVLYLLDSRNSNTNVLKGMDLATKKMTVIAQDHKVDLDTVLFHPTEYKVQAFAINYLKNSWSFIDKLMEKDFAYLQTVTAGEIDINSRTLNDRKWIVTFAADNKPVQYYCYDRDRHVATFLFSAAPKLEKKSLSFMEPKEIISRDGLRLVSYLSLPVKRTAKKLPLVLYVHGGPRARDKWGYNVMHQWLTNRGYAVLSVNYRGSSGFGKDFINAGDGEWSRKMHDDLVDAVNWTIEQGFVDPKRVGIMGGSYGGYAALVGITKTPQLFACAVDLVGPSSLITLVKSIPPYWQPLYGALKKMVGADPDSPEGQEFLQARSPLYQIDNISKPLLIGQGAHDPRVKMQESEQIVASMQAKNIPVNYVLYPDEGHGFVRPENKLSFFAITEAFLAHHLGGEFEPIKDDLLNSSQEIKVMEPYLEQLIEKSKV